MELLNEIMNKMNEIKYGYMYDDKNIIDDECFPSVYKLNSPNKTINGKLGVCWDQTELERYYFEKENINHKTYFICDYDGTLFSTHTFIVAIINNEYYYFEHSWKDYRGIEKFNNLNELLKSIKERFTKMCKERFNKGNNIVIYEYLKPKYNINSEEFFKNAESGKLLDI